MSELTQYPFDTREKQRTVLQEDADKLRLLSAWFDAELPEQSKKVQNDLRRIADYIQGLR